MPFTLKVAIFIYRILPANRGGCDRISLRQREMRDYSRQPGNATM